MTIVLAWFLADFFTGLVHWFEDRFLVFETRIKFIEGIKADNDLHHLDPTAILRHSYWGNINTTAPLTIPLAALLYWFHAPQVFIWTALFATFANLIHRFSHTPPEKLWAPIRYLQKTGIILSPEQHHKHHYDSNGNLIRKENTTGYYCAMTSWVSPIVDYLGLFKALNRLAKFVLTKF